MAKWRQINSGSLEQLIRLPLFALAFYRKIHELSVAQEKWTWSMDWVRDELPGCDSKIFTSASWNSVHLRAPDGQLDLTRLVDDKWLSGGIIDTMMVDIQSRVAKDPGLDATIIVRLKIKTVTWFVNVKLEARFEAAKELLASLGIDNSETNLFHGTAANNIQPILEGGFMIPGVSSGGKMANGKTEGYGIYLAPTASVSLGGI
ncbi:hypothetical protein B0H14DRAFT_3895413 [Mycena olivaceomarginata]|nr:hypothetical protein B0H14DRAFT_3895413 [Mycena olivaceomarginata]